MGNDIAADLASAELGLADPKGLIRESYAMIGISEGECRSILIDWALSLPAGADSLPAIDILLARYAAGAAADHPMTQLLHAARSPATPPARRGGRAGRVSET